MADISFQQSADEKAIKSHYKRLSLKFHPDKIRPDPSKNETIESLNDQYVEMGKAYKALTDEDVRNNYLQYGHPDGKQSFSIGIALPKFIVEGGNGKYVLLFYGILLGVLLPYLVGRWWYGTQALTKDRVLVASAGRVFKEFKEDMSEGGALGAASAGDEFQEILVGSKADLGLAKIEKNIITERLVEKDDLAQLKAIEDPVRRKTLALLWAYVHRIDLNDATLNDEKYEVAPVAFRLNDALTSIALAFQIVKPLLSSYHTSQNLIQAVPPNASPLLQLPYLTPTMVSSIRGPYAETQLSVQKFMALPERARRKLCSDLSDEQYASALRVAQQMPSVSVEKAFFKVQAERVITPSSLVQLVIKCRIIPPGSKNVPEVYEAELEDVDPDEDDLDALLGRKPAKNRKRKTLDGEAEEEQKEQSVQPPLAHAPYFARDHSPRWHVFLADAKQGRIAVPPFTFTAFDKPIFDAGGRPTFNMQTLKCQFQAPPQVGQFHFVMHLVCDSYIGLDTKMDVVLDVRDVKEAANVETDDEISEPDEGKTRCWDEMGQSASADLVLDTIAGQLQAMRGAAPTKRKVKRPARDETSDDDSDSDTEGDIGADTSETDTETDTDEE